LGLRNRLKAGQFNQHIWFIVVWLFISALFQFHKIVFLQPLSVHQGAQVDRASIARNYFKVSMNFFEPRMMETGTKNGITPCEFPLVNYSVALCYKLFGFNTFWYRFLMWILMGIGLWAAFDLIFKLTNSILAALFISCAWYSSSVLAYYTANFLPDVASLGFLLLALRRWIIYTQNPSTKAIVWFTIFASLACLIKITSLIFIIALGLISLYKFVKSRKKPILLISVFITFTLVIVWYIYCQWLERQVGGSYFLMQMVLPSSIPELKEWFHIFYSNWFTQIYNLPQWYFIAFGLASIYFVKNSGEYRGFTVISFVGIIGFYLLMAGQFRYHDYYVITLLPVFLFLMVYAFKTLHQINKILAYSIVSTVCIWGIIDAKNNVRLRFKKDNYWYQTFFEPSDFVGVDIWLTENGISQDKKVLAAFDPNPNTLLYFLNRRGYRTFDHSLTYIQEKIEKTDGVVTNDSTKFFAMYPETRNELVLKGTFNEWILFNKK